MTPPLLKTLIARDLCARFAALCRPDITNFTAAKWLARETGCSYSEGQIRHVRSRLGCRPNHGGKRPGKLNRGPVTVIRRPRQSCD